MGTGSSPMGNRCPGEDEISTSLKEELTPSFGTFIFFFLFFLFSTINVLIIIHVLIESLGMVSVTFPPTAYY